MLDLTLYDATDNRTEWNVELRIIATDSLHFEMLSKTWDIKAKDFASKGTSGRITFYSMEIPFSDFAKSSDRSYVGIGSDSNKVEFTAWITYDGNTCNTGGSTVRVAIPDTLLLPNESPVADLVGPTEGLVYQDLEFDASGSTDDMEDDLLEFEWDWGDGSTVGWPSLRVRSHSFDEAGTYTITVTVEDIDGATGTTSITVTITAPTRDFLWSIGPLSDSEVSKVLVDDVDDDGSDEMVVGSGSELGDDGKTQGRISIYDLATQELEWSSSDIGSVSDFELVNIDGDPALEIVVGVETQWTDAGIVSGFGYVFDGSSHSEEWKSSNIGGVTSVEIGNADSDPDLELVFSYTTEFTFNMVTFAANLKGGIAVFGSDFSKEWASTGYGGTEVYFVGDLDEDSSNEILISSISSIGLTGQVCKLSVLSWTGSAYARVQTLDDVLPNAIQVADLDGDNEMEIIVGESGDDMTSLSGDVTVYDHTLTTLWTTGNIGQVVSLAVDDVDGDGKLEVLAGVATEEDFWDSTFIGNLYIFDGQGNEV
ncbi:MAG: PKD domain-containing protein, partial [Gammaproteobacteria bacterium]|nr:PKD domain-containing protein [Gammaproteobacteria bacterium]